MSLYLVEFVPPPADADGARLLLESVAADAELIEAQITSDHARVFTIIEAGHELNGGAIAPKNAGGEGGSGDGTERCPAISFAQTTMVHGDLQVVTGSLCLRGTRVHYQANGH